MMEGFGHFCLPARATAGERAGRRRSLERRRADYEWRIEPGLPSAIRTMPKAERFSLRKSAAFAVGFARAALHVSLATPRVLASSWGSLGSYDRLVPLGPEPRAREVWRSDVWFARQRLTGINPTVIELCRELPEKLGDPQGRAGLRALLERVIGEMSLDQAFAEERMFVCDYAELDQIPCVEGRYMAAPVALFYLRRDGVLAPVAIQLMQSPGQTPVFTPLDARLDWLAARTFLQSADAHQHQFVGHLLRCHYELEAFVIAARRQLADEHPVAELFAPHFRWLFAVNAIARDQAASDHGTFGRMKSTGMIGGDVLMRRVHRRPFAERTFRRTLSERGVLDRKVLPGYWFRDDALALHGAIERYVEAILRRVYPEPQALACDDEIQAWAAELVSPEAGRVSGLPGDGVFESREQLSAVCVELIFRATAWHAALSNGQFEAYAHVINMPHGLYRPPPESRGSVDEAWLASLVTRRHAVEQVAATYAAGSEPLYTLLSPKSGQWRGSSVGLAARATFARELLEIQSTIRARARTDVFAYTELDPLRVAEGVTV